MKETVLVNNRHESCRGVTQEFESWVEFLEWSDKTETTQGHRSSRKHGPDNGYGVQDNRTWSGTTDWDRAIYLAKTGWVDGSKEMNTTLRDLRIMGNRPVKKPTMRQVGPGTLDMGRYMDGHPKPYRVMVETDELAIAETRKGQINLCVNISQSSGISAHERFQIGAMTIALVDLLERHGRRVKITMTSAIHSGYEAIKLDGYKDRYTTTRKNPGSFIETHVVLKQADGPVNMPILSFALANAGSFRRLGFNAFECAPQEARIQCRVGGGYGYPLAYAKPDDTTILIAGIGNDVLNRADARNRWLQDRLFEQGIEWEA